MHDGWRERQRHQQHLRQTLVLTLLSGAYGLVGAVLVDAATDLLHAVAEAGLRDHGQGGERGLC